MSALRTRLLFADDTDLLAPARTAMLGRSEFEVLMAGTTDEAMEIASDGSPPGAIVLPAEGAIDGIEVCRKVRSSTRGKSIPVVLALPTDAAGKRDACFTAGADDVVFPPVDAADIAQRLDRNAAAFRGAPRATVDLVVRIASPTGSAVIDAKASRISREALEVTLPAGIQAPAAGVLVRAVFTLYEGGTLQVWARVAPPQPAGTALRLVGLTEAERKSIDYFVDFYRKRAGTDDDDAAEPTMKSTASAPKPSGATSAEELLLGLDEPGPATASSATPQAGTGGSSLHAGETLRLLSEASLEQIAETAAGIASGKGSPVPPKGYDAGRLKSAIPKLSPTEASALRGTSTYAALTKDLRASAAARLRLLELTQHLKDHATKLDKSSAERIVLSAIAEAQQIHGGIEAAFHDFLRTGNTAAMKDLTPAKSGLLSACVDLKTVLDREVLGKDPTSGPRTMKAPSQVRFDPGAVASGLDRPSKDKVRGEAKESAAPAALSGSMSPGKRKLLIVVFACLVAGAAWSNREMVITPAPPEFDASLILFQHEGIKVWLILTDEASGTTSFVVDSSWDRATEAARNAATDAMAAQAAGAKSIRVLDYRERELVSRSL